MQTQPAISPLTGPGTGRLKLSAYGSQAYRLENPRCASLSGYSNAIFPRGNQTQPVPKPALPRLPDGRFAPEFHPSPPQIHP
jgi:hypothetical protein